MSTVLKRRKISHEANGEAVTKKLEKKNGSRHQKSTDKHGQGNKVKAKDGQLKKEEQEKQEVRGEWEEQEGYERRQGEGKEVEGPEKERGEKEREEKEAAKQEEGGQERQDQGKDSNGEGTDAMSLVKQGQDMIVTRHPSNLVPESQTPQKSFSDLVISPPSPYPFYVLTHRLSTYRASCPLLWKPVQPSTTNIQHPFKLNRFHLPFLAVT